MIVIGLDPGGRWSGGVARRGDDVLAFVVIECTAPANGIATMDYARDVSAWALARQAEAGDEEVLVGIEALRPPSPHRRGDGEMRNLNPTGLMGTGLVFGHLCTVFPDAVEVPPGGMGSAMLASYPLCLVGPREKRADSKGILRHARSAYDIAGAARTAQRLDRALKRDSR